MTKSDFDLSSYLFADGRGAQFISAFLVGNSELKNDLLKASNYYNSNEIRDNEIHFELIDLIIQTGIKHGALDPTLKNSVKYYEASKKIDNYTLDNWKEKIVEDFSSFEYSEIIKKIENSPELLKITDDNEKLVFIINMLKELIGSNTSTYYKKDNKYNKHVTNDLLKNIFSNFMSLNIDVKEFYNKYVDLMKKENNKWIVTTNFEELIKNINKDTYRINLKNINGIPVFAHDLQFYVDQQLHFNKDLTGFRYSSSLGSHPLIGIPEGIKSNLFYTIYLAAYQAAANKMDRGELNDDGELDFSTKNIKFFVKYNLRYDSQKSFSIMTHKILSKKLDTLNIENIKPKLVTGPEIYYDFYTLNTFYRNDKGILVYRDMSGNEIELDDTARFVADNCYLSNLQNADRKKCDEFLAKCIFGEKPSNVSECTKYFTDNNIEMYNDVMGYHMWHPHVLMKLLDMYEVNKRKVYKIEYGCEIIEYENINDWIKRESTDANINSLKSLLKVDDIKGKSLYNYLQNYVDKINKSPALLNDDLKLFKSSGYKCTNGTKPVYWLESMGIKLRQEPADCLRNSDMLIYKYPKINITNFKTVSPNLLGSHPIPFIQQYGGGHAPVIQTSGYGFINELFLESLKKLDAVGVTLDRESLEKIHAALNNLKNIEASIKHDLEIIEKYYDLYKTYGDKYITHISGPLKKEEIEKRVKEAEEKLIQASYYEREIDSFFNKMAKLHERSRIGMYPILRK